MRFLIYRTVRVSLDYDIIHSLTLEQIIGLRNKLTDIRKLRKLDLEASIKFQWKDFHFVWTNPTVENEYIEQLNNMIINRKLNK